MTSVDTEELSKIRFASYFKMINIVGVSAGSARAKYYKPKVLPTILFSHSTGGWKSKMKALTDLVPGRGSLPGL